VNGDRRLGFIGMIRAGMTPAEAWQDIRDSLIAEPGAIDVVAGLKSTEEGRAALEKSRADWARYNLAPPWEGLL
jgi:hypothetical protein